MGMQSLPFGYRLRLLVYAAKVPHVDRRPLYCHRWRRGDGIIRAGGSCQAIQQGYHDHFCVDCADLVIEMQSVVTSAIYCQTFSGRYPNAA
jgi:hypothetical protein